MKTPCTHPSWAQVWLREDKKDRYRDTSSKCTICGQRFPSPVRKDEKLVPQG